MNCPNTIINKKIVILIAHPGDEMLWFGAGMLSLCQNNSVVVYCLTSFVGCERCEKLIENSIKYHFKVFFGKSRDPGPSLALVDYKLGFKEFLKSQSYAFDLLITHPFWGNKGSHPHNIQAYHLGLKSSLQHGIRFSFFSEIELNHGHNKLTFGSHAFKCSVIISQFYILKKTNSALGGIVAIFENILLNLSLSVKTISYSILKFKCSHDVKSEDFLLGKSKINFIKKYTHFYSEKSFLIIYMLRDGKGSPFSSC